MQNTKLIGFEKEEEKDLKLPKIKNSKEGESQPPSLYGFYQQIINKNSGHQMESKYSHPNYQVQINHKFSSTKPAIEEEQPIPEEIKEELRNSIRIDPNKLSVSKKENSRMGKSGGGDNDIDNLILWA